MPAASSRFRLPVRQLVEFLLRTGSIDSRFCGFDRANEGARIHRKLQKAAGEGYASEVFLSEEKAVDGITFRIEGRADGIFTNEDGIQTIDEIKTTTLPFDEIHEDLNPCHWAQGMVYAAVYAGQHDLAQAAVRLTYYQVDSNQIIRYTRKFIKGALDEFLNGLLEQYVPWAKRQLDWAERRGKSLSVLTFPFAAYRPGQHAMAGEVWHTCCKEDHKGSVLLCQAPTGIGKTMSTLFPALRAIGAGHGEKIFYLTARNTTQSAAEEAVSRLRAGNAELCLRSITLTAKEKVCLCPDEEGRPSCQPERCPYANGYFNRIKEVLAFLLDGTGRYDRAALAEAAKTFSVCPFELGLDLSEWCDVIIGDYNYLFDPTVRLRRFFDGKGDWIFLIDEAHNLPDRARTMYSASFSKSSLTEAKRLLGCEKSTLRSVISRADKAFHNIRRAVERKAPVSSRSDEQSSPLQISMLPDDAPDTAELPEVLWALDGTVFCRELPVSLLRSLQSLQPALQDWLENNPSHKAHSTLLELFFAVQDMIRAADRYDSHFVTRLSAHASALEWQILCLDPSPMINASLNSGKSSVLFSATLTPPAYYRTVFGCGDARAVALESPFSSGNLGLFCLPAISTRYRDRAASIPRISEALCAMVMGREGNYMAFFPSYEYLRQVYEDFTSRYPEVEALAQDPHLDENDRAAFLKRFQPVPASPLLGFVVLGGIFGEGIDLPGDRLIGCAIVGVGLPQVNPQQEMLRRYYDKLNGSGFDYAYRYPGFHKVLQAAGRVIRTSTDKGVVLLLDDRFALEEYKRLFPRHWSHIQYLPKVQELSDVLRQFWQFS